MSTHHHRTTSSVEEAVTHLKAAKEHLRLDETPETQAKIDQALRELEKTTDFERRL